LLQEKFGKEWVKCHMTEDSTPFAHVEDVLEGKTFEFRWESFVLCTMYTTLLVKPEAITRKILECPGFQYIL
jgi:hypothetical protein